MINQYLVYWVRMIRCAMTGSRIYYGWLAFLGLLMLGGGISYYHHLAEGLIVTNMSDQVSWGIGIANFTFFVGVAAAAVLLIVPAYVYHRDDVKQVVLIGEILAFCAVLMCLLFIFTDIGRPDRFMHLIPGLGGKLNLPHSLLAWDVIVFNVYLVLNLHIPGYLLYMKYLGKKPKTTFYLPFVFISIFFAVSIHTVTAFLLLGLGSRAFWNSAILAPRFLISAFASGPALLILIFTIISRYSYFKVGQTVFEYLKQILRITMPINLFLLFCEVFKELYTDSLHSVNARYLYFGLHGHNMLPKFIWTAILFNVVATTVFVAPKLRAKPLFIYGACVLAILGIWTEKGMGLVFPGFIPSPLGEIVEYSPNFGEILVCLGVLGLGFGLFTVMAKVAIAIQTGNLRLETPTQDKK